MTVYAVVKGERASGYIIVQTFQYKGPALAFARSLLGLNKREEWRERSLDHWENTGGDYVSIVPQELH